MDTTFERELEAFFEHAIGTGIHSVDLALDNDVLLNSFLQACLKRQTKPPKDELLATAGLMFDAYIAKLPPFHTLPMTTLLVRYGLLRKIEEHYDRLER